MCNNFYEGSIMGTDIHTIFQKKDGDKWVDIDNPYTEDRHYLLFSWLADVRNGYGFAGVSTYIPITPISMPRGLPSDFEDEYHDIKKIEHAAPYYKKYAPETKEIWLGDHSHSWLLGTEILSAKPPQTTHTGVVDINQYKEWDKKSRPEEYCTMVMGKDVVVSHPSEITDETTHVAINWQSSHDDLQYFIDMIKELTDRHGEIRMVFGFDS